VNRYTSAAILVCLLLSPAGRANEQLIQSSGKDDPTLGIEVKIESVLDRVEYSPNLASGGYADAQRRQRYSMQSINVDRSFDGHRAVQVGVSKHSINSLRDSIDVNQVSLAYRRSLEKNKGRTWDLSIGANHSFAATFDKNSYTSTENGILTRATIKNPRDLDLFISATYKQPLTSAWRYAGTLLLGFQKTQFSNITGTGISSDGCKFNYSVGQSGGVIHQTEPCGVVQAFQQTYPNDHTLQDRLGVSPATDIQYQGWYLGQESTLTKSLDVNTTLSGGYSARYFMRQGVDDVNQGNTHSPVSMSHRFKVDLQRRLSKNLALTIEGNYRLAPFIETTPFLYTRFTAHRFNRSSPSFALSLHYSW